MWEKITEDKFGKLKIISYLCIMTEKEFEAIGNIMDNFDFDKVHEVMSLLKWEWVGTENGVPSKSELRSEARRLLKMAINDKTRVSTGGFEVDYINDGDGFVELKFVVSQWDSEI